MDTGIFSAEVEMDATGDAASDGKLQIRAGDYMTVFYDDPKGDFGDPEQVRSVALYSQTVLSGATILSSVIWTADESPYLLTGDVTVNSGATLTITKGVKVIFLADNDDTMSGDMTYDSELIVKGSISVQGTEAEPVTFTTSETVGRAGQWGGIKLQGNSASGEFKHVVVEYGSYGIYAYQIESGKQLSVEESIIRYNSDYGIRASGGSRANYLIKNSSIINNYRKGIHGTDENGRWEIIGNDIKGNGDWGIYMNGNYSQDISKNVVQENGSGVYLGSIWCCDSDRHRVIVGNTVEKNSGDGVVAHYADNENAKFDFIENIILDNGGQGFSNWSRIRSVMNFKGNQIKRNGGNGAWFDNNEGDIFLRKIRLRKMVSKACILIVLETTF